MRCAAVTVRPGALNAKCIAMAWPLITPVHVSEDSLGQGDPTGVSFGEDLGGGGVTKGPEVSVHVSLVTVAELESQRCQRLLGVEAVQGLVPAARCACPPLHGRLGAPEG